MDIISALRVRGLAVQTPPPNATARHCEAAAANIAQMVVHGCLSYVPSLLVGLGTPKDRLTAVASHVVLGASYPNGAWENQPEIAEAAKALAAELRRGGLSFNRDTERLARLERRLNFRETPGRHTRLSPVVGSRASELESVRSAPHARELFELVGAIYKAECIALIPWSRAVEAERLAAKRFAEYIARYSGSGLTPENAVTWDPSAQSWNFTHDKETADNTWSMQPVVGSPLSVGDYHLPIGIAAIHEIMHVEEGWHGALPGSSSFDPMVELLTAAATLVEADALRKRLDNKGTGAVVDYGHTVQWGNHDVPLGVLANRIRELVARHGSYGAAFASPEAFPLLTGVALS